MAMTIAGDDSAIHLLQPAEIKNYRGFVKLVSVVTSIH